MGEKDNGSLLTTRHYSIAGATAGLVARVIGQPLDVLKIRFQIQDFKDGQLKYVGILRSLKFIVREEGLTALWKGHVPAQILSVLYGSVQFATYEYSYRNLARIFSVGADKPYLKSGFEFISGGLSGVTSTIFCQPFDVLRTRLVAQTRHQVYRNLFDALKLLWRENGIRTFYKGFVPTVTMIAPNTGLQFLFYGLFKKFWLFHVSHLGIKSDTKFMYICCGAASGLCSKLAILPLDVVKKRLQVQGLQGFDHRYSGMINCFQTVVKREGASALYRGATPSVVKSTVVTAVTFFTYEQTCNFLKRYKTKTNESFL